MVMESPAPWKLWLSLLAAILSQIAAGSANLFSLYAPQLSERLGYSQTQTTIVGISMNMGMYLSGVFVGYLIDKYRDNPTPIFLMAAFMLSTGYFLMSSVYSGTMELYLHGEIVSSHFIAYAAYATIVGIGSCLCNQTSIAANLRNFPSSWRGLALGLPMSFFGLSAMILSQIAKYSFYDDANGQTVPAALDVPSFLMFLGCLSGIICLFAALVLRNYSVHLKESASPPEPQLHDTAGIHSHHRHNLSTGGSCDLTWVDGSPLRTSQAIMDFPIPSSSSNPPITTQQPLLLSAKKNNISLFVDGYTIPAATPTSLSSHPHEGQIRKSIVGTSYGTIEVQPISSESPSQISIHDEKAYMNSDHVSCFGEFDAYILAFIMFSLAGVGLMHINNVGAVIMSLAPSPASSSSPVVQQAQRLHVSLISFCGFTSQVIVGSFADAAYRVFKINRLIWISIAAVLLAAGSLYAAVIVSDLSSLVCVTALIGAGNGAAWSAAPMLVGDFFGQTKFATHFGWMSLAPAFGGQALSLIFGAVFDAAKSNPTEPEFREGFEECRGARCFARSYCIATVLCCLSAGLCVILWVRRGKRAAAARDSESGRRLGILRRGFV